MTELPVGGTGPPIPAGDFEQVVAQYPKAKEFVWAQEEPANMGAWSFIAPWLAEALPGGRPPRYVGRASSASPAVGSHHAHDEEVRTFVGQALD